MRRCAARTAPRTKGRSSVARNSRMSGAFCPMRAPLAAESAIATFHRTFSSGSCIHLRRRASVASGYERTNWSPIAKGPRLLRTYSSWSRRAGSIRSRSGSAHSAVRVRAAYFAATTTARRRRLSGPLTHSRSCGIVSAHAWVSTSPRRLAAVSRTAQSLSRARRYPMRVSSRKCVPATPFAEGAPRDRDDLLFEQEPLRELLVVHSRGRNVREAVERAARFEAAQTEIVEALQHDLPPPVVLADHPADLVLSVLERLERRVLTGSRHAHHRVLMNFHHLLDHFGWRARVAHTPSGHRVRLREPGEVDRALA